MARIPLESEEAFNTLLTSLTEDTVTASIHWRLHKDLWASVPEFVTELNQSPAFWSLTFSAHREVALFRLGRLYDQQSGALSLPSLVDTIAANQHLFDDGSFRDRLKDNPFVESLAQGVRRPDEATLAGDAATVSEKSDPLVKRLLAIRNRVFAHRDPRVILGTVQDPSGAIDNADIDTLLDRAATIVNRYGIMFRAGSSLMSIVGQDDFRRVLEHVRRDVAAYEKQIADEIARAHAQITG
jgi:AbiU2